MIIYYIPDNPFGAPLPSENMEKVSFLYIHTIYGCISCASIQIRYIRQTCVYSASTIVFIWFLTTLCHCARLILFHLIYECCQISQLSLDEVVADNDFEQLDAPPVISEDVTPDAAPLDLASEFPEDPLADNSPMSQTANNDDNLTFGQTSDAFSLPTPDVR